MKNLLLLIVFLPAWGNACAQTADSLRIDSVMYSLPEVMVSGERPMVKAEGGALVYDLPHMVEKKGVTNIFDALKELPGVTVRDGVLLLSGQQVNVMLDGTPSSITVTQLMALLRSLPVGRMERVEVMYTVPAKYQVRGALINIVLKHRPDGGAALQGETNLAWNQTHRARYGERASLLYQRGRWSADLMYRHGHGRDFDVTDETSLHTLADGTRHDIATHEESRRKFHDDSYRLGIDYTFAEHHRVDFVYNGNIESNRTQQEVSGSVEALFHIHSPERLHNLRLDYEAPFGFKAGAELTCFRNPEEQWIDSRLPTGQINHEINNNQRINRWQLSLSQEHTLGHSWQLNYGTIYTTSRDNSRQITDATENIISRREDNINVYGGINRNFSKKLTMEVSLAAEYYHTPLWHQWDLFPTLNLTWLPATGHVIQMGVSSDKRYPQYWTMNNFVTYSNGGYNEIVGNLGLRPSVKYRAQFVYVLHSKYQMVAWYAHCKDYFVQTPYQRSDRLTIQYQYLNFNYQRQAGIQASAPFKPWGWWDARLTLIGVWMQERDDDFYDLSFNRSIAYGMTTMHNTFTLARHPELTLSVDGMIRSKAHQATYDLPPSGNLDLSLRCRFWKKRAALRLFCNDLFKTGRINPRIDYRGQHLTMTFACYRELGLSFTYTFGGFKERSREEIDTSRFGK